MPWQSQNTGNMICQDPTKLDEWKTIWDKLKKMDESELYDETGCIAKCKRKEWIVKKITDPSYLRDQLENGSQIEIHMFYNNGRHRVGKQYYTYGLNSYISDFGGYLGLLLGYSIMSFFATAQVLLRGLCKKGRKCQLTL